MRFSSLDRLCPPWASSPRPVVALACPPLSFQSTLGTHLSATIPGPPVRLRSFLCISFDMCAFDIRCVG